MIMLFPHTGCRYADRLPTMPIILLTNDAGNRAAAAAMGLTALSLGQYVRSRADAPELQDLVARQVRSETMVWLSCAEPWCVPPHGVQFAAWL
jgi:hypothetical protein